MHDADRRVKFTKMVLRESLLELMREKPIGEITVTELCKNADVNRGTFYTYYKDPMDLLSHIQDGLCREFDQVLESHRGQSNPRALFLELMQVAYEDKELCRMALSGGLPLTNRLKTLFLEKFAFSWKSAQPMAPEALHRAVRFLTAGCLSYFEDWLMEPAPGRPPQAAAEELMDMMLRFMQGMGLVGTLVPPSETP